MMLSLATAPHSFGISFVNADAAADFLRVRLAEFKANASRLNPSDPGAVQINVEGVGSFEGAGGFGGVSLFGHFGQATPSISITNEDVTDFRTAVDALVVALAGAGVDRRALDNQNAFPDLLAANTVGELAPRLENLIRIFDQTVRGITPPAKPSALPIAVGISLSFVVIGALIFYFVTKR
jgi:hypothetical protein